ncbi:MAG TPA: sporulation initiation factor Spo0A C-terminal domain-containing protein [Desulfosporosinus sp.]|nr:sporulation initiation factor Spo0A C-terminal domain-containing protein [Desulfosporosinus sp.]
MDKFEYEVATAIQELRISAHFKGYEFIKSAMCVLRDKPSAIHSIMGLYEIVAEHHGVTAKRVEGNIRNALQNAKSDFTTQKKVLGTNRELTNREFLATLNEVIKVKLAGAK